MHRLTPLVLGFALFFAFDAAPARGAELDETAESAVWLLKKATLIHRDGRHNLLLRTLRQMKDPKLEPLFSDLVQKHQPVLQIHGVLGLGEISEKKNLELALLTDLKDAATQTQLVSAALEADLLSPEQCKQLVEWPGLDAKVKVLVAAKLIADGKLKDPAGLQAPEATDTLAMKRMVSLLRLQLGDAGAMKELDELSKSDDPTRDAVRVMLLQTAIRYKFASVAPWAMKIVGEEKTERNLVYLALNVAMSHKTPGATAAWTRLYTSTENPADRIRLAFLAADLADKADPAIFDTLSKEKDELIQQLSRVGRAISTGKPVENDMLKLLELNHVVGSSWVLQTTLREENISKTQPVLVGIILAAEGSPNPDRFRSTRIENCVFAAEHLLEKDTGSAALLASLIESSPELTQEAIIMGLIRCEAPEAEKVLDGVKTLKSDAGKALALLLRAKRGVKLSPDELQRLALIVRGGTALQEPLRIQAAWVYLKITQQDKFALASLLGQ